MGEMADVQEADAMTNDETFDTGEYTDPFSLDAVVDEATPRPIRTVIYGPHGIGKTTLASRFPNPIALFTEDGVRNIRIRRFPAVAQTFDDVERAIGSILRNPGDREAFVLDSLDWLEPLVWAKTCAEERIESIESPGYGKGYTLSDKWWSHLIAGFDALRDAGLHVVLLAHSEITRFNPPDSEPYDRYDLALHKRARAMIHEWADVVGFAYEKTFTISKEEGSGKSKKTITRGGGSGGRFLALERRSTWEAKNGYGLPSDIPLVENTAAQLLGAIYTSFTQE